MLAAAFRVIRADLRARPLNTLLTGLVIAFALGALVVTLHGRATLDQPYQRLFDATNGAHVTAVSADLADLKRIAALPGVVASEGPRPLIGVPLKRRADGIGLIGLPRTRAKIEDPLILEGRRLRAAGRRAPARRGRDGPPAHAREGRGPADPRGPPHPRARRGRAAPRLGERA